MMLRSNCKYHVMNTVETMTKMMKHLLFMMNEKRRKTCGVGV